MTANSIEVRFLPGDLSVCVAFGETLRDAAAQAGIAIDVPCGGQGNCGKCKVRVRGGVAEPTHSERALLSHSELNEGFRLACQARVAAPIVVNVPDSSLVPSAYKILVDAGSAALDVSDPPIRIIPVQLDEPSLQDDASDLARLRNIIGPVCVDVDMLRSLPGTLRSHRFRGHAVTTEQRLLSFVPGKNKPSCLAVAVDVGTTTLVASLIDLENGFERASTGRLNPQTRFGDDILARISYAGAAAGHLERLHRDLVNELSDMIRELSERAGTRTDDIFEVVLAGNTTMLHLVLGVDPAPIGVSPFVPVFCDELHVTAADLGILAHPNAMCYIFPSIAAYVGGDTVAGIIATRFHEIPPPALFIDIGTNGEIVLNAEGQLTATSCAAGPAFEGSGVSHGMRAASGAIEAVRLDDDVTWKVIGKSKPIGLCGSALIDLMAELLRLGIVARSGDFVAPEQLPPGLSPVLRDRLRRVHDEPGFVVVDAAETETGQAIVFRQRDVRRLQLAAAAVRSAISIVLERQRLPLKDLRRVLVAGAFGNYIRCAHAQRMGLLPSEIDPERIAFVGNAALAGARLAAVSRAARREACDLAQRTRHVDLSLDPGFQETYVDALFFPDHVE